MGVKQYEYCTKCKSEKKCTCEGRNRYTIRDLVCKYHNEGDTPYKVLGKINDIGYDVSYGGVYSAMSYFGLTKKYKNVRFRQDVTDFVNDLTKKPTEVYVAKKMSCSKCCARRAIMEKFGVKVKYKKPKLTDYEKKYLSDCLKEYQIWLKNKSYPQPPNIVMIEPLLKREGMI